MHYCDSTQLPYPCERVFDMVADIERYPEFLPGWTHARILDRHDNRLHAEQQLQTGPAVFRFHSTALLEPTLPRHNPAGCILIRADLEDRLALHLEHVCYFV